MTASSSARVSHPGVEVSNRLAAKGIGFGQLGEATSPPSTPPAARSSAHARVAALVEHLRTLDPATLVAALVVLGRLDDETDPHGIAVELAAVHLVRDPGVDNYPGGRWHRQAVIRGVRELERLRYPPTGDRDRWVQPKPEDYRGQAAAEPEAAA